MSSLLTPRACQEQHDLQHDLVNALMQLDDNEVQLTPELRALLTKLKVLSTDIQRGVYQGEVSQAEDDSGEESAWGIIIRECIKLGEEALKYFLSPGSALTLFNNTNTPIFVRTYDQNDNWRWIPYGSYTIGARNFATIHARGGNSIQADIRGRVFRCAVGVPQAYTGDSVISHPYPQR